MVHCIWYCICSPFFPKLEKDLIDNLIASIKSYKIPFIIVLTQAIDVERIKEMKNYIKSQNFNDIIEVLAKSVIYPWGLKTRAYGLRELIEKTIEKC